MLIIGITGGIAAGKSKACQYLAQRDIPVLDSDKICYDAMKPGQKGYASILRTFQWGIPDLVNPSTLELDRKALGDYIFQHKDAKKKLEEILHPIVRRQMLLKILGCFLKGSWIIVIEVPLLFETNLHKYMSQSVVIYCSKDCQLKRLLERSPELSPDDAMMRIHAQMPLEEKCKMADRMIDNSKGWKDTEKQLQGLIKDWGKAKWKHVLYFVLFYTFVGLLLSYPLFIRTIIYDDHIQS